MEEWEVCLDRLQCSYDGCAWNEVIRRLRFGVDVYVV